MFCWQRKNITKVNLIKIIYTTSNVPLYPPEQIFNLNLLVVPIPQEIFTTGKSPPFHFHIKELYIITRIEILTIEMEPKKFYSCNGQIVGAGFCTVSRAHWSHFLSRFDDFRQELSNLALSFDSLLCVQHDKLHIFSLWS